MLIGAIDPGQMNGLVKYDTRYHAFDYEQWPEADMFSDKLLHWAAGLDRMIMESYRIQGNKAKAHIGKTVNTSEVIGAVRLACSLTVVQLVMQPNTVMAPTLRQIGARCISMRTPETHEMRHARSAETHLLSHLIRNGLMNPAKY